jgi:ribosomal protein S27E
MPAKFIIAQRFGPKDVTPELKGFKLQCEKCNSEDVILEIDWAAYPECTWFNIYVKCAACEHNQTVYEVD